MNYDILKERFLGETPKMAYVANPRYIQSVKEYIGKLMERASDIVMDIIEKAPYRILVEENNYIGQYYFMEKWCTLQEISEWVYEQFTEMKNLEKELIEKGLLYEASK